MKRVDHFAKTICKENTENVGCLVSRGTQDHWELQRGESQWYDDWSKPICEHWKGNLNKWFLNDSINAFRWFQFWCKTDQQGIFKGHQNWCNLWTWSEWCTCILQCKGMTVDHWYWQCSKKEDQQHHQYRSWEMMVIQQTCRWTQERFCIFQL